RLDTLALWAGCALALAGAAAAVAASAETLDLDNIVLAQRNTGLYLLHQPLAAWVALVAVALATQNDLAAGWLGPRSPVSRLALALIGGAGAALAPTARGAVVWLAAAMLGVGGICLALGNDFVALLVIALLALAVPALLLLALELAPAAEPDLHVGRGLGVA